ncbi:hypothetical protein ACI2JA_01850 [Alkalihalobacillus sp. NPDC078783]
MWVGVGVLGCGGLELGDGLRVLGVWLIVLGIEGVGLVFLFWAW